MWHGKTRRAKGGVECAWPGYGTGWYCGGSQPKPRTRGEEQYLARAAAITVNQHTQTLFVPRAPRTDHWGGAGTTDKHRHRARYMALDQNGRSR